MFCTKRVTCDRLYADVVLPLIAAGDVADDGDHVEAEHAADEEAAATGAAAHSLRVGGDLQAGQAAEDGAGRPRRPARSRRRRRRGRPAGARRPLLPDEQRRGERGQSHGVGGIGQEGLQHGTVTAYSDGIQPQKHTGLGLKVDTRL